MSKQKIIIFLTLPAIILVIAFGTAISQTTPQPVPPPPPTIIYPLASPRAALLGFPPMLMDANRLPPMAGAENFPRKNGEIKIPYGERLIFSLSKELEGVWYPRSYGKIGFALNLQLFKPKVPIPPESLNFNINDPNLGEWVTIGRDASSDTRKGPSIGKAKVGVPVVLSKPGVYLLRGMITTIVQPMVPETLKFSSRPPIAIDRDMVFVKVIVVNAPIPMVTPDVPVPPEPDLTNSTPMPKEPDTSGGTIEAADPFDFSIIPQPWGAQAVVE